MKRVLSLSIVFLFLISCSKEKPKKEEKIEPKVEVDSTPVVKKVEPKSPILVYTVQVGAYRNSNSGLSSVSNIQISKEATLYKYRLGTFQTYKDAKRFRNKSLNNYPDAFVQALIDGKPVSITKALNFK